MMQRTTLTVLLAQLNWLVGDIEGNVERMLHIVSQHANSDIIVFSELALTGYPPEDLLYREDLYLRSEQQLRRLQDASQQSAIIVGHPCLIDGAYYNALSVFMRGERIACYKKQCLSGDRGFDEYRYFSGGNENKIITINGYKIGLLISDDLSSVKIIDNLKESGSDIILSINALPYVIGYDDIIVEKLKQHSQRVRLPFIFLNQVGGQDESIFPGNSVVLNSEGVITHQLAEFNEQILPVEFGNDIETSMETLSRQPALLKQIYDALVLAMRDYVNKNHFSGAILGLSGGIDSALTLAIAVDALGRENVNTVMMPFRYTADISISDAQEEAELLGVEFDVVSIEPMFDAFMNQLTPLFTNKQRDTTEENLQARCRGVVLMALSNKKGRLVLTTSNKSEVAVGYSTLYGDMVGGFAVLKDVPKTLVFQLAEYRNSISYIIPQRVIDRPPSAELAPDQKDQDSLPPYEVLDAIIERYVDKKYSVMQIVADGFDESTVRKVIKLIDINEYKRRQSAIGPKITSCSFGKDRRYPITSGFGRKNW